MALARGGPGARRTAGPGNAAPPADPAAARRLAAELGRALEPIERARGLPNACYTDPGLLRLERERVFFAGWACIGFAGDVPEPGDVRPVDLLGTPLVAVRGRDGGLRVFHNVCSHRGMVLVREPGRVRSVLRCPYHSWCYTLDGALKATPHVGGPGHNADPAIDRSRHGLREVRAAVWFDLIFVNVSGTAPPFEDAVRPLAERWAAFRPDSLRRHAAGAESSIRLDVGCNWKLAVENYCESYHLPWVHPGLNRYSRLEDHYDVIGPGCFSGQGTRVYNPLPAADGRRLPGFPDLPEPWHAGAAEYVALYPNALLGVHKDHAFAIQLDPVAVDRTVERIEIYYADPDAARDDACAGLRRRLAANWREVFEEDVGVVEGMQRGRASPAFTGGVFSPAMDRATHAFHRWVAERLAAAPGPRAA